MSSETKQTRENIYRLDGLSKVFKFTFLQTIKSKSYRVSFIIFVIVMIMQKPINYFTSRAGHASTDAKTTVSAESIDTIYFSNESGLPMDVNEIKKDLSAKTEDDAGKQVADKITSIKQTADETVKSLGVKDCLIVISRDEKGFAVKGVVSEKTEADVSEVDALAGFFEEEFTTAKQEQSGITEEDIKMLQNGIAVEKLASYTEYNGSSDEDVTKSQFMGYALTFSIIIFLVSSMGASYVIGSVTEEKTSKLVESLLVTVRPMALLLGKILGMLTYVLMTLLTGIIGAKIVDIVMFDVMKLEMVQGTETMFDFGVLTKFGYGMTALFVVTLLFGFLAFGILAGMLGSACSKTEDIQSATGTVMMISMAGYFGAVFIGGLSAAWAPTVLALVPPFTFFSLPVLFACGKIGVGVLIGGFAIQMVLVVLLAWLMAKTYRNLLLADNSKPKLGALLKALKA